MEVIVFNEFAILMMLSVMIGFIALKLHQPIILSFIIVGVIAGPTVLGWITTQSEVAVLASFGITLLLFIVGLKLDLKLIKAFGAAVLAAGIGQIILTTLFGFMLGVFIGMPYHSAFFVAFALSFSSTIIIVKMLSDNDDIDSLYGRMTVGILIIQDLVAVVAIIVLSSLNKNHGGLSTFWLDILSLVFKGIGFLTVLGIVMRYVFPRLLDQLADSRELLILFAVGWAILLAMVSEAFGFGKEVGGFLAGVTLASSRFRESMVSRLETVRNLLLLFFFLDLGASLHFEAIWSEWQPTFILSLFVLIGKPVIVMAIMGILGFRKRCGFLTGLSLGQISEFSLILAGLGVSQGYIDMDEQSLIIFIGIVTIALSSYCLAFASVLYNHLASFLDFMQRKEPTREDAAIPSEDMAVDVIIYGFGRHGQHIAKRLDETGHRILAIDFDPRKIHHWHHHHIWVKYGDAEDIEFAKHLPLHQVKWVISTIPHLETNQILVASLREKLFTGKIALSVYRESDFPAIDKMHVDLTLVPYEDAALSAADRVIEQMRSPDQNAFH